jgi:hypothetical protein
VPLVACDICEHTDPTPVDCIREHGLDERESIASGVRARCSEHVSQRVLRALHYDKQRTTDMAARVHAEDSHGLCSTSLQVQHQGREKLSMHSRFVCVYCLFCVLFCARQVYARVCTWHRLCRVFSRVCAGEELEEFVRTSLRARRVRGAVAGKWLVGKVK